MARLARCGAIKCDVTYVSVLTLSCNSCRFITISSAQGLRSIYMIGFPKILTTLWKYEGAKAKEGRCLGRSPEVE